VNPAPAAPAKALSATDRELVKALRDRVRPAEGDPVDVVDVRSDASDVVQFASVIDDIAVEATRTQRHKASNGAELDDLAALRDLVDKDAAGALAPEQGDDLLTRLAAFEARSREPIFESDSGESEAAEGAAEAAAKDEAAGREFHRAITAKIAAAEKRIEAQNRELDARQRQVAAHADRANGAASANIKQSAAELSQVAKLAIDTAQQITYDNERAASAQTKRLEAKSVESLEDHFRPISSTT
jgi:hypothetical protein